MGLDITAYSKCRFVAPHVDDDWDEHEEHIFVDNDPGFMARMDGLAPGWYVSEGESFGFHAGSYSGYNRWRAQLSVLALGVEPDEVWKEPEAFAGRPFMELIDFADNEGTIGPKTSAKLLADFENARLGDTGDPYFDGKYADWTTGLRIAANTGLVSFH